ncbi:MAG: rare lipoprotein [Acidobacteriales bacterium]|nr:rare lipoprotein [Terriglobales bacterium]
MRGTMKLLTVTSALVLSVGMAAASDPGTTKGSTPAAPKHESKPDSKQAATPAEKPTTSVDTSAKTLVSGKPTKKKPQIGPASWYGEKFQGRTTASGEHYDMYQLTAAHRELPLGSWIKVTNMRTGKWLIVRVNDRGPFVGNRIVDLSDSAAAMLDIKGRGVERVKLEVVPEPAIIATATSLGLE